MTADTPLDCLVIGGGPAGLTAAIYLARFRRHFPVVDGNASRAAWIPISHNHAGFPEGIHGTDLLARMAAQARKYGAAILSDTVMDLRRRSDGMFVAIVGEREILTRTVLLATGVVDHEPELPGVYRAVQRGLIRHCGICDAYEVIDHRATLLSTRPKAGSRQGERPSSTYLRSTSLRPKAPVESPVGRADRGRAAQRSLGRQQGRQFHLAIPPCTGLRRRPWLSVRTLLALADRRRRGVQGDPALSH